MKHAIIHKIENNVTNATLWGGEQGGVNVPPPIFSYLLTLWSKVLLEKLTGFQLVKKFPTFYGTRTFITAFTNVRHLSLS